MHRTEDQLRSLWTGDDGRAVGHPHFWERALSRRSLLGAMGVAGIGAATSGLWLPGLAEAAAPGPGTPRPIPGTLDGTPFHVFLPGPGAEPSTITDFNGFGAIADIVGTGVGTGGTGLTFGADMRFMSGVFQGTDGRIHQGTFGFV